MIQAQGFKLWILEPIASERSIQAGSLWYIALRTVGAKERKRSARRVRVPTMTEPRRKVASASSLCFAGP